MEIRSGYAWRPTLTTADWRPGAGIAASYPLRATVNTAQAMKDGFVTFADAGSGLAGAIVKGGADAADPRLGPDRGGHAARGHDRVRGRVISRHRASGSGTACHE